MDSKKKPKRSPQSEPEEAAAFPVTPDVVREFCDIACANDLAELDVQVGEFHLRILRTEPESIMPYMMMAAPSTAPPAPAASEARAAVEVRQTIKSPLAGVFYRAPNPGAPPYVEEGDEVREGQTVCIIEAMKLMNEIPAEVVGRVRRILVQNAQVVEAGQDLMIVDPIKE